MAWLFFNYGKTPNLGLNPNSSNEVRVAGGEQPAGMPFWASIEILIETRSLCDTVVNSVENATLAFST